MATLSEIRYDVLRKVKGQILSDDERLDELYLDKLIRDKRNFLIQEELRRGLGLHGAYMQVVDCLDVKCSELSCQGVPSGVKYHYVDMPFGIMWRINYFGTHDHLNQFNQVSISGFIHATGGRFGKRIPIFSLVDGKALLKFHPSQIDRVRLIAALDDPTQQYQGACLLDSENANYPVPVEKISRLQNLVLMDLLPTRNIQPDTTNNAADETTPADVNAKAVQQQQQQQQ